MNVKKKKSFQILLVIFLMICFKILNGEIRLCRNTQTHYGFHSLKERVEIKHLAQPSEK